MKRSQTTGELLLLDTSRIGGRHGNGGHLHAASSASHAPPLVIMFWPIGAAWSCAAATSFSRASSGTTAASYTLRRLEIYGEINKRGDSSPRRRRLEGRASSVQRPEMLVCLRGGVCGGRGYMKVAVTGLWGAECRLFLVSFSPHASSSKPIPTLCPPALKFFPSMRAERVTLMPGRRLWV